MKSTSASKSLHASNPISWKNLALWFLLATVIQVIANAVTVYMEHQGQIPLWEPMVWEASSNLVIWFLLPVTIWFTQRWPLHWPLLKKNLSKYFFVSIAWSLTHVGLMVTIRKIIYSIKGLSYHYGQDSLLHELVYEYIKDVRTLAMMVLVIMVYQWFCLRKQGEASVLSTSDDESSQDTLKQPNYPERFLVKKINREFLIATEDIEWIQAAGNYVNLHVKERIYPLRSTMTDMAAKLDPSMFQRIHRSYFVNLSKIASLEPLNAGEAMIHLLDGTSLPCSRTHRKTLKEALE